MREPLTGTTRALVAMARPSQLALVALVYGAGVLVGAWRGGTLEPVWILAGATLLLPGSIAVHWANEAADVATDALTVPTRFSGGSGALPGSLTEAPSLSRWSLLLAAGVGVLAAAMVMTGQLAAAARLLLLFGLVGGLAYSVPPVAGSRCATSCPSCPSPSSPSAASWPPPGPIARLMAGQGS